eukprot:362004-Chlamydomonas_euryale.AAC.5
MWLSSLSPPIDVVRYDCRRGILLKARQHGQSKANWHSAQSHLALSSEPANVQFKAFLRSKLLGVQLRASNHLVQRCFDIQSKATWRSAQSQLTSSSKLAGIQSNPTWHLLKVNLSPLQG